MARHVVEPDLGGLEPTSCGAGRCLRCGRRRPGEMSVEELEREARSSRDVEQAAGLRVVTDRRLGKTTPGWVFDLSNEEADTPLSAGWQEGTVRLLEEDARASCGCGCHAL